MVLVQNRGVGGAENGLDWEDKPRKDDYKKLSRRSQDDSQVNLSHSKFY